MSPRQRQEILGEKENFPLRATFLGKTGLLSFDEVDFLRQNGVDFDLDDRQLAEIAVARGDMATTAEADKQAQVAEEEQEPSGSGSTGARSSARLWLVIAVVVAAWSALRALGRLFSERGI